MLRGMAVSVRTRFEAFKRDDFTCQYCGRRSPDVVLEIDHIVPESAGGSDDIINLRTACWACNRGKADKPLHELVTGEDPHDRAILLLERERQLREYNVVLAQEREKRERDLWELNEYWNTELGVQRDPKRGYSIPTADYRWLLGALKWCPKEIVRDFMDNALARQMTKNLKYVAACCRNWRYEWQAARDMQTDGKDSPFSPIHGHKAREANRDVDFDGPRSD